LLIRLMLAAVFIYHGGGKLFGLFGGHGLQATAASMAGLGIPYPKVAAILSGGTEFFGGLILVLGPATRLVAIPMAFNMAVACLMVHRGAFGAANVGIGYPLTLGVVLLALVFLGPGRFTFCRGCWCKCGQPADQGSGGGEK
jgi:putative oxidoreductase